MANPIATHIISLPAELRAFTDTERGETARIVEGTASTQTRDRHKTCISAVALERAAPGYMRNPIVCYNHGWDMPIGTCEVVERRGETIYTRSRLMGADAGDELTDKVWARLERGILRGQSVGWNGDWRTAGAVDKRGVFWWGKEDGSGDLDWVDTSVVSIPSNTDADDLRVARSLGMDASQPWLDVPEPPSHVDGLSLDDMTPDASEDVWRKVASAACRVWHEKADIDLAPTKTFLRECYQRLGKQWPEGLDEPGAYARTIDWKHDEPSLFEEGIFADGFRKAKGLIEGNRNIVRKWTATGRVLSPEYTEEIRQVASITQTLAEEVVALQSNAAAPPGETTIAARLRQGLAQRNETQTPTLESRLRDALTATRGE